MEQRDYIKKQVELLGKVLGKLISNLLQSKNEGKIAEGIEETKSAIITNLDLNVDELVLLPLERFINKLTVEKKFSAENLDAFAELLYHLGENMEGHKSIKYFDRALAIYEYLNNKDSNYSLERHFKVERIKNLL